MDLIAAHQDYNGGIMFVSYLVSVIGALTTLELLTRRTHIHGWYNWFLLTAAAFVMGAVGIWSMHFIGNNSLTLTMDSTSYQLDYKAGYTFASLVVSIACMFISFIFVGVTEKVYLYRIIPSGIFTGLGVVCMHYLGQFAINFFIIVYKTSYVIGAIVIACVAVTAAMYIFFKLRENWMNTWYKRLGCAMLMALAVCGMHYTALVGTIFYLPSNMGSPPRPTLSTGALIGIISAIVVVACITLISIRFKTNFQDAYRKTTNKRLILDCLMFDPLGRILVKVDGTLPMEEVFDDLDNNELTKEFGPSHRLFVRLFENIIQNTSPMTPLLARQSESSDASESLFIAIEQKFTEALGNLQQELCFADSSDLGILSDSIITTGTIAKPNLFKNNLFYGKNKRPETSCTEAIDETFQEITTKEKRLSRLNLWAHRKNDDDVESGANSQPSPVLRLSIEDSDGEDIHLFLTRQLTNDQDVKRLMSQGYRFAEPAYISKTMANKLRIPTENMRQYFIEAYQLTQSVHTMTQQETRAVCMGVCLVGQEGFVLVDKAKRYAFPFVNMSIESGLRSSEIEFINTTLQGCTLQDLLQPIKDTPGDRLGQSLTQGAQQLLSLGTLGRPLYQTSVLQTTVIDLPAFSLTACPCQLIIFTALTDTHAAVNEMLDEPFKYIPLSIYKPLCAYLTDQAAYRYQRQHQSRPYSMQQQIYQQAGLSESVLSEILSDEETSEVFSLPPPPRSKRKRISTSALPQSLSIFQSPLTILPAKDRFRWIDTVVENIIHNSI